MLFAPQAVALVNGGRKRPYVMASGLFGFVEGGVGVASDGLWRP
jgi:hypothetical protein